MKTSSNAVRDDTKLTPSTIISTPAIVPMSVERLIRRTMRITSAARITPHTAPLEPPAQPGVAEYRLARRHQLLAERRVNHQAEAGIVLYPKLCSSCQACGA